MTARQVMRRWHVSPAVHAPRRPRCMTGPARWRALGNVRRTGRPSLPRPSALALIKRQAAGGGHHGERAQAWLAATFGQEWDSLLHPTHNVPVAVPIYMP